jgi:hypothetical protein
MGVIKERLGFRHEVVDRQLSHASGDTYGEAYDRALFLDERKMMMQGGFKSEVQRLLMN